MMTGKDTSRRRLTALPRTSITLVQFSSCQPPAAFDHTLLRRYLPLPSGNGERRRWKLTGGLAAQVGLI